MRLALHRITSLASRIGHRTKSHDIRITDANSLLYIWFYFRIYSSFTNLRLDFKPQPCGDYVINVSSFLLLREI